MLLCVQRLGLSGIDLQVSSNLVVVIFQTLTQVVNDVGICRCLEITLQMGLKPNPNDRRRILFTYGRNFEEGRGVNIY